MSDELYMDKGTQYFGHVRGDVIAVIPPIPQARMLEIGCGRGGTLRKLKHMGRAAEVVGVELVDLAPEGREEIDRYIVANIETDAIDLPAEHFDVVICADVLEHLLDPWGVVRRLQGLLKQGGAFVASMPNVRECRTLARIAFGGDFRYLDEGVLDRTHLRFFCRKNIIDLLSAGPMRVERVTSDLSFKRNWRARLNRLTFGVFEQFLVTQYLVVCRKN